MKLRESAKPFFKKEIGNGRHVSFWYDNWSDRGVMVDLFGDRGIIDLGIKREATIEEVCLGNRRRRRHRTELLNDIEVELASVKEKLREDVEDVNLWQWRSGFKSRFLTQETWLMIRKTYVCCNWAKGVWFAMATPKFAFMSWLAMLDRLSTMDRVAIWNQGVDSICVLCKMAMESRNHLFFECSYSSQVWEYLTLGILRSSYSNVWSIIVPLICDGSRERMRSFCIRYALQSAIYAIWRERNRIRHGEKAMPIAILKKTIDKGIRNKLSLIKKDRRKGMERVLQFWFETRI